MAAEKDESTFGSKVEGYADKYEKAMKENAEAFKILAVYCIDKGVLTTEQVLSDA